MIRRAIQNPELIIYVFGYSDSDRSTYLKNLRFESERSNFKILTPENLFGENKEIDSKNSFTLSDLTNILTISKTEV